MKLTDEQISALDEKEQSMLRSFRKKFAHRFQITESISEGFLLMHLVNSLTNNSLELSYDDDLLVLGVGKWCHDHPKSVPDALEMMEQIIDDRIVIWKVTRPDGYWYSGFYDIDEWKEKVDLVDEPDTGIESGDKLEKSTFSKRLEDKVIE